MPTFRPPAGTWMVTALALTLLGLTATVAAQEARKTRPNRPAPPVLEFPPTLPGGAERVTDTSPDFLKPSETIRPEVKIARTPPTIEFQWFPGQTYKGSIWSNWGNSLAANGKYYCAIGDHDSPQGNAFVYEYDPATKKVRTILDIQKVLNLPEGHYVPGKIHTKLGLGADGWIYCATHRGSPRTTTDEHHYKGDWILRANPETGEAQVVAFAPVPNHAIPTGALDPERLIFYGGTAAGVNAKEQGVWGFAYDVQNRSLLWSGPDGPARDMIVSRSTGRVYWGAGKDGKSADSQLVRFDPDKPGPPVEIPGKIGIRTASPETRDGIVYTASQERGEDSTLYAFDVKTEKVRELGPAPVGSQTYVACLDLDPTGRYLYYIPGAHGGSQRDNSAVVQYDTKTNTRKVIAFLHPFYQEKYGFTPVGTYAVSVDEVAGDKLYVCWNISRGSRAWDVCGLTVIHIPESERQP